MTETDLTVRILFALIVAGAGTLACVYILVTSPPWARSPWFRCAVTAAAFAMAFPYARRLGLPPWAQVLAALVAAAFAFGSTLEPVQERFDAWPRPYRWRRGADRAMAREREARRSRG